MPVNRGNIHQGPGNLWLGCAVPPTGTRLIIDVNGNPTATGVLAPPAAPTLSSVAAGTLAGATYYVIITLLSPNGETTGSPETSLAVLIDNELVVQSPPPTPGAIGWNAYVSVAIGTEKLQNTSSIAIGSNWTQTVAPTTTGVAPPVTNNTTAIYTGAVEGADTIMIGGKIAPISADQVTAPIDARFTGESASIAATLMETTMAQVKNYLANGIFSTGVDPALPPGFQNYEEISYGGLFIVPQFCIALISPRVESPGKYVVNTLYQAYQAEEVSMPFSKEKSSVVKVKFDGLAIPSRPLGDQVGKIYRQP